MAPLSPAALAAFTLLTLALALLWLPAPARVASGLPWWGAAGAAALLAGAVASIVDAAGLAALLLLAVSCVWARRAARRWSAAAAHAVMLLLAAGLFVHRLPGFDNPLVLDAVRLAPDSLPYTKYFNFDKGMAALVLLGLYAPERTAQDRGPRPYGAFAARLSVLVGVVLASTLAAGYARWDPKLPPWWPAWLWSMACLTALPEETLFRGLIQGWLQRAIAPRASAPLLAAVAAGLLFGLAHAAGGVSYALLAAVAGVGYGWIYVRSGSLAAAALAHTGLNGVHLLLFSYPALSR